MYVSSRSVNHNINSPFLSDVGVLSMVIPMVRLHNSGKFSCGTIFQSQCASWFWQSQHWGCESNEDVISQLSEGSGLARWLSDISWGWMGWFVANYSYLFSWRISFILVRLFCCCVGTACCGCIAVLAGSDASFDRANSCIVSSLDFSVFGFLITDISPKIL